MSKLVSAIDRSFGSRGWERGRQLAMDAYVYTPYRHDGGDAHSLAGVIEGIVRWEKEERSGGRALVAKRLLGVVTGNEFSPRYARLAISNATHWGFGPCHGRRVRAYSG